MALLDLLGRRGCLRVLWELRGDRLTFRALQEAADTNPSALNTRLAELREAAILDHDGHGYGLTPQGHDLLALLMPLQTWAEAWAK